MVDNRTNDRFAYECNKIYNGLWIAKYCLKVSKEMLNKHPGNKVFRNDIKYFENRIKKLKRDFSGHLYESERDD